MAIPLKAKALTSTSSTRIGELGGEIDLSTLRHRSPGAQRGLKKWRSDRFAINVSLTASQPFARFPGNEFSPAPQARNPRRVAFVTTAWKQHACCAREVRPVCQSLVMSLHFRLRRTNAS